MTGASRSPRPGATGRWRYPALALYLAVALLAAAQVVVTGGAGDTVRGALPYLLAATVLVAGRRAGVPDRPGTARRWATGLAVAGVALALWASQAFVRALPSGVGEASGFYRVKLQVTTPLGDHNTAAGLLLVGVVVTVVLAVDDRRWWVGTALTGAGIVACLSRGAATVLVAVAIGAWVVGARRRVAVALAVAAVGVLGAVIGAAAVLDASPPPGAHVPDGPIGTSVLGRVDLVARGFEVGADHPVLGVGLGGFQAAATDLPRPNDHAHNSFAHAAAEGGLPLLVVAVGLVVLLGWRGWQHPDAWRREVLVLGGGALVLHAQLDVLGGRLGHEVVLAALLALGAPGRGLRRG